MKPIGCAAIVAILFSMPVFGQAPDKKPAAVAPAPATKPVAAPAPAMKPAAAPAPAMKAEKETTKVVAASPARKSRALEDARSCLQLATNAEVIKCAEEYR